MSENQIAPEEICKDIWNSKSTKHQAINYKTAYGLLAIFGQQNCIFCKNNRETMDHIFVECTALSNLRREIKNWLDLMKDNTVMDRDLIIYSKGIKSNLERFLLSEYKITIWLVK